MTYDFKRESGIWKKSGGTYMSDVATQTNELTNDFSRMGNLSGEERALLHELVRGLRSIRFGSISLTVHDGRLVEIHKTEKIRRKSQ
jgi:hypothetical protein